MSSKECKEQLKSLVEAWDLDEALLNQTDIEAIRHLMLENKIQQNTIKTQKLVIDNLCERITSAVEYIKANTTEEYENIELDEHFGQLKEILKEE